MLAALFPPNVSSAVLHLTHYEKQGNTLSKNIVDPTIEELGFDHQISIINITLHLDFTLTKTIMQIQILKFMMEARTLKQ